MTNRLQDKVAIITGASRGIGAAIAAKMAQEGAKVVLVSRKIESLERVASGIGHQAFPFACHVGHEEQRQAMMDQVLSELGKVDILVNNAATNPHFGPMMSVDWAAWDKTFEVNLKGYFAMSKLLIEHLRDRGAPGSIVNIASVLGRVGAPLQGVYGMTKAAVISMTKTLAMELGGDGIRVNAIAPGLVRTRFAQVLVDSDELRTAVLERMAIKRVGEPEDIAGAAAFLASDEASYLTGEVIVIDGGWTVG